MPGRVTKPGGKASSFKYVCEADECNNLSRNVQKTSTSHKCLSPILVITYKGCYINSFDINSVIAKWLGPIYK